MKDWIDGIPFSVTDREKTIIDGLDLPQYVGGVSEIAKALRTSWKDLDEKTLRRYMQLKLATLLSSNDSDS